MGQMEAIESTYTSPAGRYSDDAPNALNDRDALVSRFIPCIYKVARSIGRRLPAHFSFDDIVSAGALGLLDAARRYDPSMCERFEVYAELRIRGAILDELRSHDSLTRDLRSISRRRDAAIAKLEHTLGSTPTSKDVADELGLELDEYDRLLGRVHRGTMLSAEAVTRDGIGAQAFEDTETPDPFQVTLAREIHDLLEKAVDYLPARLQVVARLYYTEGLKLNEIGARLGVTEARACQLRGEALKRLREILCSWGVESDLMLAA